MTMEEHVQCAECGYENAAEREICDMCAAELREPDTTDETNGCSSEERNTSGQGVTESVAGRRYRKKGDREDGKSTGQRFSDRRSIQLFKYHPIAGAGILFGLLTITGLPESLVFQGLLMNLGASVLVGAPMGFMISYIGGGFFVGALISMVAFSGLDLLMLLVHGQIDSVLVVPVLMQALLWGWIPGSLIGIHVNHDVV